MFIKNFKTYNRQTDKKDRKVERYILYILKAYLLTDKVAVPYILSRMLTNDNKVVL